MGVDDAMWKQKYFDLTDKFINPPIHLKRDMKDLRYIILGHWEIEVIFADNPIHQDGTPVYGMWNSRYKTITLDASLQDFHLVEILWHELTHAILEYFSIDEDNISDELVCLSIGRGIALLAKDNPELMETLNDC